MAHFHSYVSKYRDPKDTQEDEANQEPDTTKSDLIKDTKSHQDCFPCPHCERRFTCKQGLERHMHIHNKKKTLDGTISLQLPDSSSSIETSEGHHPCKFCTKVFNSLINRQRHERRFHEVQTEETQEESPHIIINAASQEEVETGQAAQIMLDISSNISENVSFFIDGKLVSTSTVHEMAEVHSGSALVSVDALILDPSQVVNAEQLELANQAKRRTATPPILPQIKTVLKSEVVVPSSSVIEDTEPVLLPIKDFLEKQDGLKPTSPSPVAISVLPASARFKRRTSTPQHSEETSDSIDCSENFELMETQNAIQQMTNEIVEPPSATEQPAVNKAKEIWPLVIGGNSCNQKPLDLSNTIKRSEDVALDNTVLDLSLQKKDSEQVTNVVSNVNDPNATNMVDISEQNATITPLLTDFAFVTSSDIVTPVDQVTEGLLYGLAIPTSGLNPSPNSLAPVTLQPAPPCAIAFASPNPQTILPTTPSLITVLAPPPLSTPNQPIQVLAPNISTEPLVICTDNGLNASDLTTAINAANSANLVALSQPIDPNLNLPGHVFLADPISLNAPLVDPTPVALNDLNSYNITSNTVLIECTISLEAAGNVVPATITLQDDPIEQPAQTQMLVNHIEQQQIVSMPSTQNLEPTILTSSIAESVLLSTSNSVTSESSAATEDSPVESQVISSEQKVTKDGNVSDKPISQSQNSPDNTEKAKEEDVLTDSQQQTFTKNFTCNVCDKLFHSMKALGQHVTDHADDWPYKCEFCLLLFEKPASLLEHRSSLHGVGKTYVCSICTKEFVYLCNLKLHQEELHPGQQCTHTEDEKGKLRPPNYNNITKENEPAKTQEEIKSVVKKEEAEVDVATDELFTTLKIMTSDKHKGPDVRLGINQHYPSFKPPPFPYHNRSPTGSVASATNFTTHNIPQTFSTAIRCTKCGNSFDNMPELHKHILICANASDKRRYTPKKNPIPLRHFAKSQNGVLSTTNSANGLNTSTLDTPEAKMKLKVLNKRKKKFSQKRNKSVPLSTEMFPCPHCSREFTMRRSRTKHMAVCPKKPSEVRKWKDGVASVTNENDGHQLRGISHEKLQSSPHHKTRLQTGTVKRPATLPVQTFLASKRSKIIIKESGESTQDTLNDLPIVRTFNPGMRQYSRMHHSIREIPIKITIVKPQQAETPTSELVTCVQGQEAATASTEQRAAV